ncbi:MAG: hypothetical protein ABUR63_05920 [Verrucomicrobiota bacterium]
MSACRSPTNIVLVVDTDLVVPGEIDSVGITVTGSEPAPPVPTVDLTAPGAPAFPLTLGLAPANGSSGSVDVAVVGYLQGSAVVQQEAGTMFVGGSQRMLRMLLLGSCKGVSCPTDQTCGSMGCSPTAIPGTSLPPWTGSAPPRPSVSMPIGGRTVWANGWHSCANEGPTLYCWGQNYDGEIGNGSQVNAKIRQAVFQNPSAVGLGQHVTCACDKQGQAWCWGRNTEGEIGIGGTAGAGTDVLKPTKVPGVTDCAQISGGAYHTCVVHTGGTVSCWGGNGYGQVGQPTGSSPKVTTPGGDMPVLTSPQKVPGLMGAVEVEAGDYDTCARLADMTISCWGRNDSGQLGDGTTTSRSTPAPVGGLGADVVGLAVGRAFACVWHLSGRVSCWGGNDSGQLGNGATGMSAVPVDAMVTDATQLAAGFKHTCAIRSGGGVSCWGRNETGQLGDGTTTTSLTPVSVANIAPGQVQVNSIAAGSVHTCARYADSLVCWGENVVNEVGDDTSMSPRLLPVTVAGF